MFRLKHPQDTDCNRLSEVRSTYVLKVKYPRSVNLCKTTGMVCVVEMFHGAFIPGGFRRKDSSIFNPPEVQNTPSSTVFWIENPSIDFSLCIYAWACCSSEKDPQKID